MTLAVAQSEERRVVIPVATGSTPVGQAELAILLQTGLIAAKSGGLHDCMAYFRAAWPGALVELHPHHANLSDVAERMRKYRKRVHVGHSLGASEGLGNATGEMDVDLAICIDRVPQVFRSAAIPSNVGRIIEIRTDNRSIGAYRTVIDDSRVVRRVIYVASHMPPEPSIRYIENRRVVHENVDEMFETWNEAGIAIRDLMDEGPRQP